MINTICDNTLLLAFSRRQKRIDSSMIQETFSGLMEIPGGEFPGPAEPEPATEPAAAPPSPEPAQPEPAPPPPPAIEVGAKRETEGPVVLEKQDIVHATLIKISDPERLPEDLPHYRLTDNARRELLPAFVSDDPAATRQYHILTTRLGAIQSSNGLKSVMVTSSIPQEGKTVTAINLGVTMAQESSAKVVVVDCDLRQPAVHKYLGLKPGAGTTEVLTGKAFLEDAIVRFEYPNLFVIPSGKKPMNPMEVMESAEMEHFLAELAKRFHFVIVDSPPVVPIADACVLAGMVDGVILVARARSTDRKVINQAIEDLSQGNILGIVLNDHQLKISKSKYHYGYTAHGREGREAQGA